MKRKKKKAKVAMLISDKNNFKAETIMRNKEKNHTIIINATSRYRNYKCICTQSGSTK